MNRFPYVPIVLETHYEDATFLYLQWCYATSNEATNSEFTTRLKQRLDANLNGLLLQPQSSLKRAFSDLTLGDPGELFVAAFLAYQIDCLDRIKQVVDEGKSEVRLFRAVADGLAWRKNATSQTWTARLMSSSKPDLFSLGYYAFNAHGMQNSEPACIAMRNMHLSGMNLPMPVFALLLQATQLSGDVSAIPILRKMFRSSLDYESLSILKTRMEMGDTTAIDAFAPFVVKPNDWREETIRFIFPHIDQVTAKQWITELRQQPHSERYALIAIGALRTPELLPWVLQRMENPKWARIAGQAFSSIMGLDLAAEGLALSSSEWEEAWFDIDGDEELDWPDVARIRQRFAGEIGSVLSGERRVPTVTT